MHLGNAGVENAGELLVLEKPTSVAILIIKHIGGLKFMVGVFN